MTKTKTVSDKSLKETPAVDVELVDSNDLDDDDTIDIDPVIDATEETETPQPDSLPVFVDKKSPARAASTDSLSMYLREISKFPMLKPEEEFALAKRVQEFNDSDAAFRLVSSHLRLVVKIAMDFQRRWMQNVLDLIQEGNVGLMRAVNKFDPDKGIKFSYYASFWIKAYILKFIMDNWRLVKVGTTQAQRKLFYNLNKERQRLISQGFDPDTATLSKKLNVSEEQVIEMEQRLDASDMSLDIPVGDDTGGATRMDFLPALGPGIEDVLSDHQMAEMLTQKIADIEHTFNEKELAILHQRLLSDDPITLREIGEKFAITRERVRQIEARLLQKIRDHLFKEIKDFSKDWIQR
ncbi:MAG: RNA polymerase factor sigma-32 [Desulfovibrionales bacterium]|nr:RNA polymerase factor sigma-32 [Desulfovibrionales bacterium]